jgi:hypothetical protein
MPSRESDFVNQPIHPVLHYSTANVEGTGEILLHIRFFNPQLDGTPAQSMVVFSLRGEDCLDLGRRLIEVGEKAKN